MTTLSTKIVFKTSTGETLTADNPRLIAACETVAQFYEENARAILASKDFPAHVTQARKEEMARYRHTWAKQTRQRENLANFSVWQRVNTELTGECVAFLP